VTLIFFPIICSPVSLPAAVTLKKRFYIYIHAYVCFKQSDILVLKSFQKKKKKKMDYILANRIRTFTNEEESLFASSAAYPDPPD
jgi:hypothetical protein